MPKLQGQTPDADEALHEQTELSAESGDVRHTESRTSVIELADLTSGSDTEISRLKSNMSAMSTDIDHIRGENVKLAAGYQKLDNEVREIKLVLAKAHAKELRAVEGRSSWLESLNDLQGIFKKNHDS